VLAVTGHTFHDLIGTHYQQDVDLTKLFMDVWTSPRMASALVRA
jgi:thiamine pyrophosphate-dependent acetolactate synthase large subunit-like protein